MKGEVSIAIERVFFGAFLQGRHQGKIAFDQIRAIFEQLLILFLKTRGKVLNSQVCGLECLRGSGSLLDPAFDQQPVERGFIFVIARVCDGKPGFSANFIMQCDIGRGVDELNDTALFGIYRFAFLETVLAFKAAKGLFNDLFKL